MKKEIAFMPNGEISEDKGYLIFNGVWDKLIISYSNVIGFKFIKERVHNKDAKYIADRFIIKVILKNRSIDILLDVNDDYYNDRPNLENIKIDYLDNKTINVLWGETQEKLKTFLLNKTN